MAPMPTTVALDRPTEERLRALYDAHAKPVYGLLLRLTFGDRQAAEDLLQETMLRAWQHIDGLNPDVDTLRPWLMTVARRLAIDVMRARQARPTEVGAVDLANMRDHDDAIEQLVAADAIRRAMPRLSPEHRDVIIEIYFGGRSGPEVARLLGIPEGTVKSRAYHALRTLRAAMVAQRQGADRH